MSKKTVFLYFCINTIILLIGLILILIHFNVKNEDLKNLINFSSISGSLIATSFCGYLIYWAMYIITKRNKFEEELIYNLKKLGVINIKERRLLYDEYSLKCKNTHNNYDMMGFGLSTFIEDNKNKIDNWAKKFKIRILVLNPDNPNCKQRDYEENDQPGKLKKDILNITKIICEINNPKIKLKWYNAIPVTNILRMDNIMWVGPYFINERSRNAYVLKLEQGGELFDKYLNHFETIWNDNKLSYEPKISDIEKFIKNK